jgi:hypothetical protein
VPVDATDQYAVTSHLLITFSLSVSFRLSVTIVSFRLSRTWAGSTWDSGSVSALVTAFDSAMVVRSECDVSGSMRSSLSSKI